MYNTETVKKTSLKENFHCMQLINCNKIYRGYALSSELLECRLLAHRKEQQFNKHRLMDRN